MERKKLPLGNLDILQISFFGNSDLLMIVTPRSMKFFSTEDFSLKKELTVNLIDFVGGYFELDDIIYFAFDYYIYSLNIDFQNNLVSEKIKSANKHLTFTNRINNIEFFPQLQRCCLVFSNYEKNHLFIYNLNSAQLIATFKGHKLNIKLFQRIRTSPNFALSLCSNYCVLWDLQMLKELKRIKSPIFSQATSMEINKSLMKLYFGLQNGTLYVFDFEKGCEEKMFQNVHLKKIDVFFH